MMFAGHLPTMNFDLTEWQCMPVFSPEKEGDFPSKTGFWRDHMNGKPIVFWFDWDHLNAGYAVRPVIRVPMGSA
jgi:hypothetical protein